jgi:hypothetical protein
MRNLESRVQQMFPHHNLSEVRATSLRSAAETTSLLNRLGMIDLRSLGCPDDIFETVLEQRAAKHVERRAEPPSNSDDRTAMSMRLKRALQS